MKKTLLTLALVCATAAAFAQGKVSLQNDGTCLFTLGSNHLSADAAFAGQPIPTTGPLPSGVTLIVGLFGGTSSSVLTLQGSVVLNNATGQPAGYIPITHITSSLPGGNVATYWQVWAWDNAYATPQLAEAAGSYYGSDNIFTMTAGTSISYPPINGGGGSTWVAAGNATPFIVGVVPEPTTFALAGLGAAALLIFRRRK